MKHHALPFGNNVEIVGISPGYNISEYVKNVKRIKKLREKILFVEEYKKSHGRFPNKRKYCIKKYESLTVMEKKLKELKEWRENFENSENLQFEQGTTAIVIFRKQTDCKTVLEYWKESEVERLSR